MSCRPAEAAARYPVLVVAALYTAADEDLDFLAAYAESGGHLVLGPRSAYADPEARPREERQPAVLSKPAGVGYDELANLPEPRRGGAASRSPGRPRSSPSCSSPTGPRCSPATSTRTWVAGRR